MKWDKVTTRTFDHVEGQQPHPSQTRDKREIRVEFGRAWFTHIRNGTHEQKHHRYRDQIPDPVIQ